ncbi:hypothetical protein CCH79_00019931, partial [Gambusia affinis]
MHHLVHQPKSKSRRRRFKMAASKASRELFTEGVRAVLQTWPVLQIAVDNGFGGVYGQQKADWMVDVVQQYFHDNEPHFLSDVSQRLLQLFSLWQQGALQQLGSTIDMLTQSKTPRAKVTAPPKQSDDEEIDSETQAGDWLLGNTAI